MIRRDMPRVMKIDDMCFNLPWSEDEYIRLLRQRNCIGMVAELGDEVVGYMIYELHKKRLDLIVMAVDPGYMRRGIGSTMIGKLTSKLSFDRRNRITCCVSDSNLGAQLFLRDQGFKAVCILRGVGIDGADEYEMVYRVKKEAVVDE